MKLSLATSVDQDLSNYDFAIAEIHRHAASTEAEIRESVNRTFHAMAFRHTSGLAQREFDKAIAIHACEQHPVPYALGLRTMAKGYARRGEIDVAIQIRGEAEVATEQAKASGRREIDRKFALLQKRTLKRQGNELQSLQISLARQLSECKAKADRDVQIRKMKVVAAIRRDLVAAIAEARRSGSADFGGALTEFLEEKLIAENRAGIFENT
jgi:hypothetical protein